MDERHPGEIMMDMLNGYMLSQCIYAAATLGVADRLDGGAKSIETLAVECGAHESALYRVMRLLASHGIFVEPEPGTFELTALAGLLRSDFQFSMRDWAIYRGDPYLWRPWGNILHSVKTGEPALDAEFGMPWHEYLSEHPETSAVFDAAMRVASAPKYGSVRAAYDFGAANIVADIGGGNGGLLASILRKFPGLNGMLCDRPFVVDKAAPLLEARGVADRCTVHGIDMFEAVPQGADLYMLASVIHDWDDADAVRILTNCAAAMPAGGKLLLVEFVIPPGNEPHPGKMIDVEMLVMTGGGKERTEAEYAALFEASGLRLCRVIPTQSPFSIIEGALS